MKRKFSAEFKAEAVKLVLEQGLAPALAARDLGIGSSTMCQWLKNARGTAQPQAITENEKEELKRLRKEVHYLRMERDILKKATAYFSRASLPDASGS
jgi:transposase